MASVAAGEELYHLIRMFSSDLKNLPLVRGIGDFFSSLFNLRSHSPHRGWSDVVSPTAVENLVFPDEERHEVDVCNLFPEKKEGHNHNSGGDPHAVFNVLDMVLVESMERLKKFREEICMHGRYTFSRRVANILSAGYRLASDGDAKMIRALCATGKAKAALELYVSLLESHATPDLHSHNCLMNGLCKLGDLSTAIWLLERMSGVGVSPNIVTYNTLVKGFCRWGNIEGALDLVSSMSQVGVKPDTVTCNTLVHALCTRGLDAENFLAEILEEHRIESNVVTSTVLMNGCCRQGYVGQALHHWNKMFEDGIKVDLIAYNVIINGFCLVQDMKIAYKYFSEMFKRGLLPDVVTFNTLISGFTRTGNVEEACDMLDRMEVTGIQPDEISYKLVIHEFCRKGNLDKAVELLRKMLNDQLAPDHRILNPIINCFGRYGDIVGACSVRDVMVAMGVIPNVFTYNALIHAYVKAGMMRQAILLKKEMLANGVFPDAVTYNLLIGGATSSMYFARPLIPNQWKREFQPDKVTYTEWIRGLCLRNSMEAADIWLDKLMRSDLPLDHVPFQILIKKYCKKKQVSEALEVYKKMMKKRLVGHFSLYRSLFIALRKSRYYVDASQVEHEGGVVYSKYN